MKKKVYSKPQTEIIRVSNESLLVKASPGVSNKEYDPDNEEVGAKKDPFDNEDDSWSQIESLWND